jgi:hypothetical protein
LEYSEFGHRFIGRYRKHNGKIENIVTWKIGDLDFDNIEIFNGK